MPLFARAVSAAAAFFTLAGLTLHPSAGLAAELPPVPLTVPIVQPADNAQVPALALLKMVQDVPADAEVAPAAADAVLRPDDTIAYPTLAAAVADQQVADADNEDLRCLAGAIYFESRGEPLAGQLGVAEVILNRAQSGRFARSVCGVVTQPGQFSFVRGGRVPEVGDNRDYRTAMAVAKVAMTEAWESNASNALFFNARRGAPGGRVRVASIGNHVFYR